MSTEYSRKCDRINRRQKRARDLLASWINGNRSVVLEEARRGARLLAAIVAVALNDSEFSRGPLAAHEICEALYREKDQ